MRRSSVTLPTKPESISAVMTRFVPDYQIRIFNVKCDVMSVMRWGILPGCRGTGFGWTRECMVCALATVEAQTVVFSLLLFFLREL